MSQVRFQEHKIEGQKIIQHERENLEWGLEIIETYKKTNQISDIEYLNTKNEILKSLGHNSALLKSSQS